MDALQKDLNRTYEKLARNYGVLIAECEFQQFANPDDFWLKMENELYAKQKLALAQIKKEENV